MAKGVRSSESLADAVEELGRRGENLHTTPPRRTEAAPVELQPGAQWRMADEANVPCIPKPSEPPRANIARPRLRDRMLRM